ncbi:Blastula protease 10 [Nymphon striatum]|nr:Blastula protease 10 [Nymphon striatum]
MTHTCIVFIELHENEIPPNDYLVFNSYEYECSADIGRERSGPHEVSLGRGCEHLSVILHEVGHALGMFHEQSRSDRDQYIKVITHNISPEFQFAFNKELDYNYGIPYDYTSIMHYMRDGFSVKPGQKITISTIDPTLEYLIKERKEPSFRDIKLLNMMYKCNAHCPYNPGCKHEGYMDRTCECRCREGTSGKNCENKDHDYYPPNKCGGIISRATTINSPVTQKIEKMNCIWWIQAPRGNTIKLRIESANTYERYNDPSHPLHGSCVFEAFGVRTKSLYEGDIYCGRELYAGKEFHSCDHNMVLTYELDEYQLEKGFTASIEFVKQPGRC